MNNVIQWWQYCICCFCTIGSIAFFIVLGTLVCDYWEKMWEKRDKERNAILEMRDICEEIRKKVEENNGQSD